MGAVSLRISDASEVWVRLQTIRRQAGLSRIALAQRAGIAVSTVYLLEDGIIDPHLSTVLKLAAALEVTPDYLLGLADRAA